MKLQFRLRTLMVVVTLLAVPLGYVGWQAKIVRERKESMEQNAGGRFSSLEVVCRMYALEDKRQSPGVIRRWLGDEPQVEVLVLRSAPIEQKQRAKELFPEATINEFLD